MQFGEGGKEGAGEQHLRRKDQERDRREAVGVKMAPEKWWLWESTGDVRSQRLGGKRRLEPPCPQTRLLLLPSG